MPEEDYSSPKVLEEDVADDHALSSIQFTEEDHNVPIANYKSVAEVQADPDYKPYDYRIERINKMADAGGGMIRAGRPLVLMTENLQIYQADGFWKLAWVYFKAWVRR